MHAGESYPGSGLRGDNTLSPALRGLRMITTSERVATNAPRAVGFNTLTYRKLLRSPTLVGYQDLFLAPLPGSHSMG